MRILKRLEAINIANDSLRLLRGAGCVGMSHISTVTQTRATSRYCCMDVVWDGRTLDFPVSKEDFSEIAAGDKVLVTEYDGFWGAPYYTWEIPQSP